MLSSALSFFFQAEDGIRYGRVTGVQTCALPIFTSFKTQFEALAYPPTILPKVWQWHNYPDAWKLPGTWPKGFGRYFLNTIFIASLSRSEERRVGKECRSRWSAYEWIKQRERSEG